MMFCMIFQKGLLTWVYPRSCQRCHFYSTDYTSLAELWCPSHSRWFNHCHKVMNITAQEIKLYFYIVLTTLQNPSLQSNTDRLTGFINWTYTAQYLGSTIMFKCSVSKKPAKVMQIYPRMKLHKASPKGLFQHQCFILHCSK